MDGNGNYDYVDDEEGGLRVIDVSNPAAPDETGFYGTPGSGLEVATSGDEMYIADYDGGLFNLRLTPRIFYLPLVMQ